MDALTLRTLINRATADEDHADDVVTPAPPPRPLEDCRLCGRSPGERVCALCVARLSRRGALA
jgi:hypothetical protein